eukprot:5202768-Amphidinium_carterae.1
MDIDSLKAKLRDCGRPGLEDGPSEPGHGLAHNFNHTVLWVRYYRKQRSNKNYYILSSFQELF